MSTSKYWTIANEVKIATIRIVCSLICAFLFYMLDEFNFYRQHNICIYTVMVAKIVQTCNVKKAITNFYFTDKSNASDDSTIHKAKKVSKRTV